MKSLNHLVIGLIVLLSTSCAVEDYGETESSVSANDETSLNGTSVDGVRLASVGVNGHDSTGGALSADYASTTSPPLHGSAYVGSTWTGTTATGTSVDLRIVSGSALASPNSEVWEYSVEYLNGSGWHSLCGGGAAISSAGVWNVSATWGSSSTQFTIACRSASIPKCIELGYKTYRGYTNQMASCVRMMMADYCGTGATYTVAGQLINLYDNLNIQVDTQAWLKEGAWGPAGAKCLRTGGKIRYVVLGTGTPPCAAALYTSTCGNSFGIGQYVIDEVH